MHDIETFIAINRFGLGYSPNDNIHMHDNAKDWLKNQIKAGSKTPLSLQKFRPSSQIIKDIYTSRKTKNINLKRTQKRALMKNDFKAEVYAKAKYLVSTQTPFTERLVLFWSNHFTVSSAKPQITAAIPAYEREQIRPNIYGKFEDLLIAAIAHPTMLTYLDNDSSIGPNSKIGLRRKKTFNENLAREILELHTLGVNGGYLQKDIIELAKIITGWTHDGFLAKRLSKKSGINGKFAYRDLIHEPGSKTVLGKTYVQEGINEGIKVLKDLARHPSTAKFIATKLARHFVSDEPKEATINKLAKVYLKTDGDLSKMYHAIIELDETWKNPLPKVKTPYEFIISTLRAVNPKKIPFQFFSVPLISMAHTPYSANSPQGWPDTAKSWISPESLLRRIEWARAVSARLDTDLTPQELLKQTIGIVASDQTIEMVKAAPSKDAAMAIIFSSSQFQRR